MSIDDSQSLKEYIWTWCTHLLLMLLMFVKELIAGLCKVFEKGLFSI